MPAWIIYALLATFFAGLTPVLAKSGIEHINADLGLAIRTAVVFGIVLINLFTWNGHRDTSELSNRTLMFLILSGITTGLCWIFYYRAMKAGELSTISAIDKGSILLTILLSVTLLNEPLTYRLIAGAGFILFGTAILIWQK